MSATDELRRLLDELGAEHSDYDGITEWCGRLGAVCRGFQRHSDDHLDVMIVETDPGSAIDATLERGKCKTERHGSLANWPEMVCWSCSECGFGWHHSINDKQFSYCPNCGRRIEA